MRSVSAGLVVYRRVCERGASDQLKNLEKSPYLPIPGILYVGAMAGDGRGQWSKREKTKAMISMVLLRNT